MKANNYKRQMKDINEIYVTAIIKAFTLYTYRLFSKGFAINFI